MRWASLMDRYIRAVRFASLLFGRHDSLLARRWALRTHRIA